MADGGIWERGMAGWRRALRSLRLPKGPALEPGVTIVVPACDVGSYLGACLDSLLAQTWWEHCRVLVVDDGSTDKTGAIVDSYAAAHPRIEVLHQPNRGPGAGAARNAGLDLVRTEYVLFLDGDDELVPRAIELLAGGLERHQLDLAVGATEQFPEPRGWLWSPYFVAGAAAPTRIEKVPLLVHNARTCNKLYRTSWLRRTELRFAEGIHHQDTVVNVPAMLLAPRFLLIGDVVDRYRKRADGRSVMDSHFTRLENYIDHLWVIEILSQMLPRIREGRRPLLQQFIVRSFQGFLRRAPGRLPAGVGLYFLRCREVIGTIPPKVIAMATADADHRAGYVALLENDMESYRRLDELRLAVHDGRLYIDLPTRDPKLRELLRTGATRAWLDELTPLDERSLSSVRPEPVKGTNGHDPESPTTLRQAQGSLDEAQGSSEGGLRARLRLRIRGARNLDRTLDQILLRGISDDRTSFEVPVTVTPDDAEGREHTGQVVLPSIPGRHLLRLSFVTPTGSIQRWVRRPEGSPAEQIEWGGRVHRLEVDGDRAVLTVD